MKFSILLLIGTIAVSGALAQEATVPAQPTPTPLPNVTDPDVTLKQSEIGQIIETAVAQARAQDAAQRAAAAIKHYRGQVEPQPEQHDARPK